MGVGQNRIFYFVLVERVILFAMGRSKDFTGFIPNSNITKFSLLLLTFFINLSKLVS